ncbi:MAG: hypothetical protein JWM11_1842 [Planctomycetaceae bacterium]|nr:hypothetical protein [Planctomycetaceae bacterium]
MLPPENPWPAVIVLLCVAIGFGLSWNSSRKKSSLAIALISLGLGIGCYAWSQLVDTPSKQVIKNLHDLVQAFENQNAPKVMSYFSKQANIPASMETLIGQVKVKDHLRITDVSVTLKQQNSLAILHFRANGGFTYGSMGAVEHFPTRWELEWQREANEWKIVEIRRLHLMNGAVVGLLSGN